MNKVSLVSALIITIFIAACDVYPQDEYEEHYVVEAYLVAGRPLPQIILSTTAPADAFYSLENTAVNNGIIEVRLLSTGNQSEVEETFDYRMSESGIYDALDHHRVLPLRTYELNITFPASDKVISAHTVVPDTFRITGGVRDSVVYHSSEQLEVTVSESSYPGRQNIFVFNSISLNPRERNLTPLYRSFYEDGGYNPDDLYLLANNDSGIINEGNFEINPDGSFTISYPWVGFSFFEENLLVANTIDDNVYDFIRSRSVQLGGSSLSPGEIQNVIYNIKGGVGVFGSIASDSAAVYVKRPIETAED